MNWKTLPDLLINLYARKSYLLFFICLFLCCYATISAKPTMSGMVRMDRSVDSDTILPEVCG